MTVRPTFLAVFAKLAPYLILLLGFALRLYHLGANSLWYDETVSMYLAQSDLAELLRHTAGDIHPPLYYILLHAWGLAAGYSGFAAAFFSLGFGVLLIAVVWRVTRAWFPAAAIASVAALLVALSPYNIWYSQEVRMYTLGATLGLLSVFFLRRMLAQPKIFSRAFVAYVLVTVLGFYTLYYFIFLMVFQYLWVGIRLLQLKNQKSKVKNTFFTFLTSQILLVVLYLPWLSIAFRQATDPPVPPWREFISLPDALLESLSALVFGQALDYHLFGFFALLLLIPITAVIWRDWQSNRAPAKSKIENPNSEITDSPSAIRDTPSALFLFCYTFIPLISIWLFSLWKPLYHVRYIFTYSPAFYILAAYALVNLIREFSRAPNNRSQHKAAPWLYGLGALALLVGLAFFGIAGFALYNYWHNDQYARDDLRGAVTYLAERWRPSDAILVNAGYAYPAVVYYYPEPLTRDRLTNYLSQDASSAPNKPILLQTGSIGGAPNLGWNDSLSDFYPTTADETRAALDRVFADHPRVWMLRIYDTVTDPEGIIRAYFDQNATLLDDRAFTGESQARVQGFLTQPALDLPPDAVRLNQTLGERVQLVGYEPVAPALERGSALDVVLYWQLLRSVNHNYQVTLQLLDANGENVAQSDDTRARSFAR